MYDQYIYSLTERFITSLFISSCNRPERKLSFVITEWPYETWEPLPELTELPPNEDIYPVLIDSLSFKGTESFYSFLGLPFFIKTENNIFYNFEKGISTKTVPKNPKNRLIAAIATYIGTIVSGV
jgi:hypothetical protein